MTCSQLVRALAARFGVAVLACHASAQLAPGEGVFTYVDNGGNANRPVPVHYVYPPGFDKTERPRILFAMHGSGRDALGGIERFRAYAYAFDALLLCPEFSLAVWPDSEQYGQGNVRTDSGIWIPESDWTLSTIEEIFALIAAAVPNAPDKFDMVGHSAGGQFVHRMAIMKPRAPLGRMVAANAGWYLLPTFGASYPNGIDGSGTGMSVADVATAFARDLTISLGTLDTDPDDPDVNHSTWADQQGLYRYARGHYFYDYCRNLATSQRDPFHWRVVDVPGVAHDSDAMAPAAIDALFDVPTIHLPVIADTYVKVDSTNYGSAPDVWADGDSLKIAYMKFDLSSLHGAQFDAAALRVHVLDSCDAPQTIRAVDYDGWNENTVVYNNRPAAGAQVATGHGGSRGEPTLIPLTAFVQANLGQMISFTIESSSPDGFAFASKESTHPPELVIWKPPSYGVTYGTGTAGSGGVPTVTLTREPRLAGSVAFELAAAAANRPYVSAVGHRRAQLPVFGFNLLVDPNGAVTWLGTTNGQGRAVDTLALPDAPGFEGTDLDLQVIVVDPRAPQGFAATRGVEFTVGS